MSFVTSTALFAVTKMPSDAALLTPVPQSMMTLMHRDSMPVRYAQNRQPPKLRFTTMLCFDATLTKV
jgi:hypothetical protein